MKIVYIIMVLLVAVVAVIFALQNSVVITVTLFSASVSGSLSLFLIVTLAIGLILGMLLMVPVMFKRGRISSGLKRQVSALEKEKDRLAQKPVETEAVPETNTSPESIDAEAAKKRG